MVNSNELLYVVDEFDSQLEPKPRHEVMKNGLWRRTVHVWIVNDKKQIFCQKRSLKKDMAPGKWEPAVAGHLGPQDNYFTGAVREVYEETGLSIKANDLQLIKIYRDHEFREYRGVFYCKLNPSLHEIKTEADEVEKVKFVNSQTLKKYLVYQKSESWIRTGYEKEIFSISHFNNI